MKIYKLLLIIICFSGILLSCNTNDKIFDKAYSNKDMNFYAKEDFKNIKPLNSEKLPFNYDSIIFPGGIDIINNHLILLDQKRSKPINVFNLGDFSYIGNYGSNGQGPGEIIAPLQLSHVQNKDDNSFFIYDLGLRKILGYSLESLLMDKPLFERKINESGFCSGVTVSDNNVYYSNLMDSDHSFSKLDTLDNSIESFGSLLYNEKGVSSRTFGQACASRIIYGKNKVITAYTYAPYFEIFDNESKTSKSILTVDEFAPIYKEESAGGKKFFAVIRNETKDGFADLDVTDEYIYMLYSGKVFSEENLYTNGDKILVFDYDGNPIHYYELDTPIYKFKVLNDKTIIGLSSDVKVDVLRFDL